MLDEIQEAKSTDVLLIEGEYETNKITKENLFKGLVKDEDFESKTEGLVKEDQLTETLKNYVTAEQLGDSLGKLDQLDSIGSLKSTKFDYAEVYTDSATKETVIDFYAGSNPNGTAIKNEEGIYDTDFIDCVLCSSLAENAVEYCKQGDLVGIKGRLQNNDNILNVVAEKLTFLSSSRKSDE